MNVSRNSWRLANVTALCLAGAAASAMAPGSPTAAASSNSPSGGETLGFVLNWFQMSPSTGTAEEDCPDGFAKAPPMPAVAQLLAGSGAGLSEEQRAAIQKLSPQEQQREARKAFASITNRGPNGENVCLYPLSVPDPGMPTGRGDKANGLDLDGLPDGQASATTCAHDNMTAPDGRTGIDNQWARVQACIRQRRGDGFILTQSNNLMLDGEFSILIEVTGVDDRRNDPDVTVALHGSTAPVVKDSTGEGILRDVSFTPDMPQFSNRARGRIVNGVVETTEPIRVRLPQAHHYVPRDMAEGRIRFAIKPDGSIEGVLGGYRTLDNAFQSLAFGHGAGEVAAGPYSCDGVYHAAVRLADGGRDRRTGQCASISAAYDLRGVPAFVVHQTNGRPARAGMGAAR